MTVQFLFIDDDVGVQDKLDADAAAYARSLMKASGGRLAITPRPPATLGDMRTLISAEHGQGLLLDVQFVNAAAGEAPTDYDGIALAQQVRTLQTRGALPSFPIVRFSKKQIVAEYVGGDTSSNDLFDDRIDKEDVLEHRQEVATRLVSLAEDYPLIGKFAGSERALADIAALLGLAPALAERLDDRSFLGLTRPDAPAHTLAQYLISTFLRPPGVLMGEALLAVRLGVDIKASPDWPAAVRKLEDLRYRGAFAEGFPRFWTVALGDWWLEKADADGPLKRTEAAARVEAVKRALDLTQLSPLAPTPESPGARPWHICVESGVPVDPAEGFALMDEWGHEPWQDTDYISAEVARHKARTHKRLRAADRARALKARADA